MRNPFRAKNLRGRFLPVAVVAAIALAWHEPRPLPLLVGAVAVLGGVALRTWAAGHLVKRDELTVSGPYAHVRHPLYLGTLVIGTGFALALGGAGPWLMAVLLGWFFACYAPAKERAESARLEELHGGAYTSYRARVRALLPSLAPVAAPGAATSDRVWQLARYDANNELGTLLGVAAGVALLALRAAGV